MQEQSSKIAAMMADKKQVLELLSTTQVELQVERDNHERTRSELVSARMKGELLNDKEGLIVEL